MAYVHYHPVFLALKDRRVLIVGGGKVAVEKLESLMPTGALITVISPKACPEVMEWDQQGRIHWVQKWFKVADVEGFFMVIAATENPAVNALIFRVGDHLRLLTNSVDDPANCNFIMAAITRQGPMQVAVSSAGCSPALAQRLRKRIGEELLTPEVGRLAEFLGFHRPLIKKRLEGFKTRQRFWESVIDSGLPDILEREGWPSALEELHRQLDAFPPRPDSDSEPKIGKVILLGAGPGDPDLMTLKGAKALQEADVVLYDRLSNRKLLENCSPAALLMDVGKARGECGRPRQEAINALLIEHARRGRIVVRLKGGDPFVFGRGGEEILALREAEIPYQVIPGISSSIAAPGAAEIPVTHRGLATGFAVFTAQGAAQDVDTVPWNSLKEMPTLVLLMGVEQLPKIVQNLKAIGRDDSTPVAIISHATLKTEQTVVGTLSNIVESAKNLPSPATIVVGQVVTLANSPVAKQFAPPKQIEYTGSELITG